MINRNRRWLLITLLVLCLAGFNGMEVKAAALGEEAGKQNTEIKTEEELISVSGNLPSVKQPEELAVTAQGKKEPRTEVHYEVGEGYRDLYTEEDIKAAFAGWETVVRAGGEIQYFDNYEALYAYVKNQMLNRTTEFSFTMQQSMMWISDRAADELAVEAAMKPEYSTSNKDGDYLAANYIGYSYAIAYDDENGLYTCTYRFIYTSTADQEAQVDAMVSSVLASLQLDKKSEYEKVKAIHDYIAEHVTYNQEALDYYYETGNFISENHSTYAALVKGNGVCQGYASLFYRMCKESGIGSRCIRGRVFNVPHQWNIVKVDGKWYGVDVTSDDLETSISYNNFLKSKEYTLLGAYTNYKTDEFLAAYPLSDTDYPMPEEVIPDTPTEAFVKRMYTVALNRAYDSSGCDFWVSQLEAGLRDGANVAKGFILGKEMQNRNLSNEKFVDVLYQTFFDRMPPANDSGKEFWINLLENGVSRAYVFRGFCHSNEFTEICGRYGILRGSIVLTENKDQKHNITMYIYRCYDRTLERHPDGKGLNYWAGELIAKRKTASQVAGNFVFSKEFVNRKLSDEEFIKIMYRMFFDREFDKAGLRFWLNELESGNRDRYGVFKGFANSKEFNAVVNSFNL